MAKFLDHQGQDYSQIHGAVTLRGPAGAASQMPSLLTPPFPLQKEAQWLAI